MDEKNIRLRTRIIERKTNRGIKKLLLASFFLFAAADILHSAPKNPGQRREIFRYVYIVNGAKLDPEIDYRIISNRAFAFAFARIEWTDGGFPARALDRIYPEFSGIFDSAQAYSASSDDGEWLSSLFERLSSDSSGSFSVSLDSPAFSSDSPYSDFSGSSSVSDSSDSVPTASSSLSSGRKLFRKQNGFSLDRPEELSSEIESLENISSPGNKPFLSETPVPFPEKRLRTSEKNLRLHLFESEALSLQFTGEGKVVVVSDGKTFSRKYYDSLSRLSKKENWTGGASLEDMKLVSEENFEYAGDELKPLYKTTEKEESRQKITYDGNGRIVQVQDFDRDLLSGRTDFIYTEDGKIREQIYTEFRYSEKNYGKILQTSVKRDVYEYSEQDLPPDYYYYEDDRLCLKTVYSGKNDWISTMYFDNGFTVESFWRGGKRLKDDYYLNGSLARSRNYGE